MMTRISIAYCTVVSSSSFLHRPHMDVNVEGPSSNLMQLLRHLNVRTLKTQKCRDGIPTKIDRFG